MLGKSLEATITGVSLASLLTGFPRLCIDGGDASSAPASPSASELEIRGGNRGGPLHPLEGDAEGLLFGRVASVLLHPDMQDMASQGTASGAMRPSTKTEGAADAGCSQMLTVERHWEMAGLSSRGFRQRLFNGAGAVQSQVLHQALRLASREGAQGGARQPSAHAPATGLNNPLEPAAAEQLNNIVGWFVRRRESPLPLRPSMRETAATVALQRWVAQDSQQTRWPSSNKAVPKPVLLLLISGNEGAGVAGTAHTCTYRLYVFNPMEQAAGRRDLRDGQLGGAQEWLCRPPLRPLRLQVLNLGNSTRPQYGALGSVPLFLGRGHMVTGQEHSTQDKAREEAGAVLPQLADQAQQQVQQVEGAYQQQMQHLQHLALELAFVRAQGR